MYYSINLLKGGQHAINTNGYQGNNRVGKSI